MKKAPLHRSTYPFRIDTIAVLLQSERRRLGLTQEQVARLLGVKRQLVTRVESGRRNITLDTVIRIADVLGLALSIEISEPQKTVKRVPKRA